MQQDKEWQRYGIQDERQLIPESNQKSKTRALQKAQKQTSWVGKGRHRNLQEGNLEVGMIIDIIILGRGETQDLTKKDIA